MSPNILRDLSPCFDTADEVFSDSIGLFNALLYGNVNHSPPPLWPDAEALPHWQDSLACTGELQSYKQTHNHFVQRYVHTIWLKMTWIDIQNHINEHLVVLLFEDLQTPDQTLQTQQIIAVGWHVDLIQNNIRRALCLLITLFSAYDILLWRLDIQIRIQYRQMHMTTKQVNVNGYIHLYKCK